MEGNTVNRVAWNGLPLDGILHRLPTNLAETIFNFLPPSIPPSPVMDELAARYRRGEITPQDYAAMQAAVFLSPASQASHESRRNTFERRREEAEAHGFVVPSVFRKLVETDAYVDRLHHNNIWLQLPDELWPLARDRSRMVFLAFTEGQGCCNWHLLLAPDGSHVMIACEHPFGLPSNWLGSVPDDSHWQVEICADSIEEWLYFYFLESYEHTRGYIERLRPYHSSDWCSDLFLSNG